MPLYRLFRPHPEFPAFGADPQRAYYEGCSNGGREGSMAAQRNPTLFDGILARAGLQPDRPDGAFQPQRQGPRRAGRRFPGRPARTQLAMTAA